LQFCDNAVAGRQVLDNQVRQLVDALDATDPDQTIVDDDQGEQ
jgi:hypothetical protein